MPKFSFGSLSALSSLRTKANFIGVIIDEIKELMHAAPFRPVRIVLGDQQAFIVTHTDYLMVSPDRQTVVLYDKQGRFKIINVHQIRLVEPMKRGSSKAA